MWNGLRNYFTGTLTSLHSFDLTGGTEPYGLTQATSGEFYGVTLSGGTGGYGTIFSLSTGLASFVETLPAAGKAEPTSPSSERIS